MSNLRLSCQNTVAQGKPPKADWSTQSLRFHARKRGATLNNQMIISHEIAKGYDMRKVKSIHTNHDDGKVYGLCKGRRVVRNGWAYSMTARGHTPGRWFYVEESV